MNSVFGNTGPTSTGGGRSESPSQWNQDAAPSSESRADGGTPPAGSEATLPFTPSEPRHDATETVTETDRLRCGTGGGREDEPELPVIPPRRRNVLISLPVETHELLELRVKSSGLPRQYFIIAALLSGSRRVVDEMNESLRA